MMRIKTKQLILKLFKGFFFIAAMYSCSSQKNEFSKYNYFNKNYYYNDSLKIGIDFDNDTQFITTNSKNKKELKKYNLSYKNLLAGTKSSSQQTLYFYQNINGAAKNFSFSKVTYDSIKNIISIEKQSGTKKLIALRKLKSNTAKKESISKANNLITQIAIDTFNSKKLSYFSIYNNYFSDDHSNDLFAHAKMITAPKILAKYDKNNTKFQLLATINSHIQNNKTYDSLLNRYEKKRKEKFTPLINNIANNPDVYSNNGVLNKIKEITAANKILILNEDHYYPKHRIFGMELLPILKQNGYKYISLEAFFESPENNFIPNKENGPYITEPYFAHFIREAKKLGFIIVGHENTDDNINRELGQAKNILKILDQDADAKIFIYVGHSHLEKKFKGYKWMAEHLKDLSQINPVTINQVAVCAANKEELMLIPNLYFTGNYDANSSADYFLVNNIKTSLKHIYIDTIFKNLNLEDAAFKKYTDENVLVEVIDYKEYQSLKENAIAVESSLTKPKGKTISIELPLGHYQIFVKTIDDKTIYNNNVILK